MRLIGAEVVSEIGDIKEPETINLNYVFKIEIINLERISGILSILNLS